MFQTLQQLVRMVQYLGCKGQRAVPVAVHRLDIWPDYIRKGHDVACGILTTPDTLNHSIKENTVIALLVHVQHHTH